MLTIRSTELVEAREENQLYLLVRACYVFCHRAGKTCDPARTCWPIVDARGTKSVDGCRPRSSGRFQVARYVARSAFGSTGR